MKTKRKNKHPKLISNPQYEKKSRACVLPNNNLQPEFKTCKMDMYGRWGWSGFAPSNMQEFLNKLFESQKLTWQELRQKGSHPIQVSKIICEARKRLRTLQLDDWEELYSLRFSGKPRVWGLKEVSIFWILWWDPNHEIYPSQKKHT